VTKQSQTRNYFLLFNLFRLKSCRRRHRLTIYAEVAFLRVQRKTTKGKEKKEGDTQIETRFRGIAVPIEEERERERERE
jgi:hypothetical protein